jgi:single-strand DNA-binding protein
MAGLCKAVLIGHLGRDPEVRYTPDGLAVTNFSMAATEKVKGEDRTQWFRITCFGRLGEVAGQYLSKGKQVYIEGRLQTNEWTDQEGNKRFSLEVIASQMQMLGTKGDSYDAPRPAGTYETSGSYNAPRSSSASSAYDTPESYDGYDVPEPVASKPSPAKPKSPAVNAQPEQPANAGPQEDDIPF